MEIRQFEDKNEAHYSYAVVSNGEVALIDPSGDAQPFLDFSKEHRAVITTIIYTSTAFVNNEKELHLTTGATVYVSRLFETTFPHQTFDEGDAIILGHISLKALNTPGHSNDSICIVALNEYGSARAVFTGDTLLVGDCGRPDTDSINENSKDTKEQMAKKLYCSLRNKLMNLPDSTIVYPAHSLQGVNGKDIAGQQSSTIGYEKINNWSLQNMPEENFVEEIIHGHSNTIT